MKLDHILQYQGHGETILVMDPDESVRALLYEILKLNGYHILLTDSAGEGEREYWLNQGKIDLVLADLWMPELSIVLAKMLHFNPNTAVLFTTHYAIKRFDSSLVDMLVLEKPFDVIELFSALKLSLSKSKGLTKSNSRYTIETKIPLQE